MNVAEAQLLLGIAASFDNRKPSEESAVAWFHALDGLRFEDCRSVVVAHYQRTREWLMPADVIEGVRRIRAKRIADFGPIEPPAGLDPDDTGAYVRFVQDARQQIADGTYQPPPAAELKPRNIAELGQIGHKVPRR